MGHSGKASLITGITGALGAVVAGLRDWQDTDPLGATHWPDPCALEHCWRPVVYRLRNRAETQIRGLGRCLSALCHAHFAELDDATEAWAPIREAAERDTFTLLYCSHDREHDNAVGLKEYIERKMAVLTRLPSENIAKLMLVSRLRQSSGVIARAGGSRENQRSSTKLSSPVNIPATAAITTTTIRSATTKRSIVASRSSASESLL